MINKAGKHFGPGATEKGKGAGGGALTDLQHDLVARTWCSPIAIRPSTPVTGVRIANGLKPNNARTMPRTRDEVRAR
jgi:hypothetical protein